MESGRKPSLVWPFNHAIGVNPRSADHKGSNHPWRSQLSKARRRRTECPRRRLIRSNRRGTDPYARWCGRGGTARCPPIPINPPYAELGIRGSRYRAPPLAEPDVRTLGGCRICSGGPRHGRVSALPQPAAGRSVVVSWPVLPWQPLHYQYIVFQELKIVEEVC